VAATRRFAAILFADMAGKRPGGGSNDAESRTARREGEEIVRSLIAARHGRELQARRAGLLVRFPRALDAVQCAIDLQQRLRERNAQPEATPIQLRIGVHVAGVEGRRGTITDEAIRLASRLESAATPGGVCVSAAVVDQVQDQLPNRLERVSSNRLASGRSPIDVFRVRMPWDDRGSPTTRTAAIRLAVLPFENVSPDPQDDYFADGLSQEVIAAISKIRGLRVIARTSVREYRDGGKPVSQIGAELDVASVLKGSVCKSRNRLRVTLQLIDTRANEPLWETSYDRELADVFAIQTEIAERTAGALRLELVGFDRESVHKRPTASLPAYHWFLKGIHAVHQSTVERYTESLGYFEEAIRLDPRFALAYAHLANALLLLAGERIALKDAYPRAKELARRALELDPNSAEAHTARGNLALQIDQNWPVAEAEFQTALSLNPSDATAHYWYAVLLKSLQRFDEAIRELETVLELDPLWELPRNVLIGTYHNSGDLGSAVALAAEERSRKPGNSVPHVWLGLTYSRAGKIEMARREAALASGPIPENYRVRRAVLWALLGEPHEARLLLRDFEAAARTRYVRPTVFAALLCVLGEGEQALGWLERDLGESRTLWLDYQGRAFDPIRGSPRFKALLKAMNLPIEGTGAS
jgi:adenylate cyclase